MADKIRPTVFYEHADDKNVAALVVYVDEDGYACMDADFTRKLTADELINAFVKRCVIKTATGYAIPIACTTPVEDSTDYASITYGEATAYSSEYTASPEDDDDGDENGDGNGDNLGGDS